MAKKAPDMYENKKREKLPVEGNVLRIPDGKINENQPENSHKGHRERLRKRFLNDGLENFEDHNALELLLFYSIPMKDTNEEAHALMHRFGTLSEVFDADFDELCKVKGISTRTATLIKLMPELFRKYEMDKLSNDEMHLNSAGLIAEFASKHFKGINHEQLYVLCLDKNCKKLRFDLISEGTVNATMINNRKITEAAVLSNAASIVLVHNHPSGVTAPSSMDIAATTNIVEAMDAIGIRVNDHIIIGHGGDYFSFRNNRKWRQLL